MDNSSFTGVSDVLQRKRTSAPYRNLPDLVDDILLQIVLDHDLDYYDIKRLGGVCKKLHNWLNNWVKNDLKLDLKLFRVHLGTNKQEVLAQLSSLHSPAIHLHPTLALSKSFVANKLGGIYIVSVKPIAAKIQKKKKTGKGPRPKSETRNVAHRPHKTFPVHELACAGETATSPPSTHLVIQSIGSSVNPDDIRPIDIQNTTGVTVLDVVRAVVERWTSQDGGESEWKKVWQAGGSTAVWSGWSAVEVMEDGSVELRAKTFGRRHRRASPPFSSRV
ncbi:hypothetical protein RQP46_001987 [Phenoliferia psychrophenolica]